MYAKIGEHGGARRIYIKTPFALKERVKSLNGARFDFNVKQWHIPASQFAAEQMYERLSAFGLQCDPLVAALVSDAANAEHAQALREADDLPEIPGTYCQCLVPVKLDPRDLSCDFCGKSLGSKMHQRQAFWFIVNGKLDGAMLNMDMGTGKTKVVIALCEHWQVQRVIVACPKNVVPVWPKELRIHAERRWYPISAAEVKGTVAAKARHLAKEVALAEAMGLPWLMSVHYDVVWRTDIALLLKSLRPDVWVLDESHRAKAPGGKTAKFLSNVVPKAGKRIGTTGTLMPHGPMDVYAQYRAIEPGIYGTSFSRFRAQYAVMGGFEDRQVIGYQNEEEFNKKWGQIAYICKADDVLDLPEFVPIERTFDLAPKAAKAYQAVEDGYAIEVAHDRIVSADNALTKMIRLSQITSGYLRDTEGDDHPIESGKAELLADVLEDVKEPCVIFYRFTYDATIIRTICEGKGLKCGELSGRARTALTSDSKMNPNIDVAIVQLKSGGVGIDLTRASVAIYYSMDHSLGDFDQSKARLRRPGQRKPGRYIFLLASGTKDIVIFDALKRRKVLVESFVEAARRRSNTFLREVEG